MLAEETEGSALEFQTTWRRFLTCRHGRQDVEVHRGLAGAFSEGGNPAGVAAQVLDVGLHPAEGHDLVLRPQVARESCKRAMVNILSRSYMGNVTNGEKEALPTKCPEAILHGDEDHVLGEEGEGRVVLGVADHEPSPMEPHHHGQVGLGRLECR